MIIIPSFFSLLTRNKYKVALFLYSLLPLLWFPGTYLFRGEEVSYINYSFLFDKYLFAWSDHINNGAPSSFYNNLLLFPVGIIYKALSFSGLPEFIIQRGFFTLVFSLTVSSIYLLCRKITGDRAVSFISSIIYTANFYFLSTPFYSAKMFQMLLLPILFSTYLSYLETRKALYILVNFFFLFIFKSIFVNPPNALGALLAYPLALFYYLYAIKRTFSSRYFFSSIKNSLLFFIPIVVIGYSVFNSFLYSFSHELGTIQKKLSPSMFLEVPLEKIFQMFHGAWWEGSEVYNIWLGFYKSPATILFSLILFSVPFILTVFPKATVVQKNKIYYWGLALLLFVFLAHGTSAPFGILYELIYKHIPLFYIFREPWAKFIPLVVFSYVLMFASSVYQHSFSRKSKLILLTLTVLVIGYPFVFGYRAIEKSLVSVPDYWKELRIWSLSNKHKNVLVLPIRYRDQLYHNWYGEGIGNFYGYLTYFYQHFNSISNSDPMFGFHFNALKSFNPDLISVLNVDYVLDQRDIGEGKAGTSISVNQLKQAKVIEDMPEVTFGKLDLYKVREGYHVDKIFSPDHLIGYSGSNSESLNAGVVSAYTPGDVTINLVDVSSKYFKPDVISVNSERKIDILKTGDGLWNSGFVFPSASIDPSSFSYMLVRIKERYDELIQKSRLDRIDRMAWNASKRIAELEIFPNSGAGEILRKDYFNKMSQVVFLLKEYKLEDKNNEYWEKVIKILSYIDRARQVEDSRITKLYDDFYNWISAETNIACGRYCYNLEVPFTGYYAPIIVRESVSGLENINRKYQLKIGKLNKKLSQTEITEDLLTFEKVFLESGIKYDVDLLRVSSGNLFPKGDWFQDTAVSEINSLTQIQTQEIVSGVSVSGGSSNSLTITNYKNTIRYKDIEEWVPNTEYLISFDYKVSGGKVGIALAEEIKDIRRLGDNRLKILSTNFILKGEEGVGVGEYRHVEQEIISNEDAISAKLYVYSVPFVGSATTAELKDLRVSILPEPVVFFKLDGLEKIDKMNDSYAVKYKMLNPTKFLVTADGGEGELKIVLNSNFHRGWKVFPQDRIEGGSFLNSIFGGIGTMLGRFFEADSKIFKRNVFLTTGIVPVSTSEHHIANGYANIWSLTPEIVKRADGVFIIEYTPQRYYYLDWIFSSLTITVILAFLGYGIIKRHVLHK